MPYNGARSDQRPSATHADPARDEREGARPGPGPARDGREAVLGGPTLRVRGKRFAPYTDNPHGAGLGTKGVDTMRDAAARKAEAERLWLRAWALALMLLAIGFGGWELFWRSRGFVPSVTNDARFWAVTRERASSDDPDTVVLVGSSRMQLAIEPDAFTEATGWQRPIQLAIAMGPSLPILRNLAEDPRFRGTAVVEINPAITFNKTRSELLKKIALVHLWSFRALSPSDRIEKRLAIAVQTRLVTRLPGLAPARLLGSLRNGSWPVRNHVVLSPERFGRADFRVVADQLRRAQRHARQGRSIPTRPHPADRIPELASEAGAYASRIQSRGGQVIFVRLPSAGDALAKQRAEAPRELYWDVFAEKVGAPVVHFADHPSLSQFRVPDGTHLDVRDASAFSRALARILAELAGSARG